MSNRRGLAIGVCAGTIAAFLLNRDVLETRSWSQHAAVNLAAERSQLHQVANDPPPPPPPPSPPSPPPPSLRPTALVAICVGGWLELSIPRRAASIRENVLSVMPSDVFVAGTVRGNATADKTAAVLDGIGALAPFAAASVIRMPRPAELRAELKKSGLWEEFKLQASKGGSGRFNWKECVPTARAAMRECAVRVHGGCRVVHVSCACVVTCMLPGLCMSLPLPPSCASLVASPEFDDPTRWVPIMMSPALGNPNGNTLQEFHYQSCASPTPDSTRKHARRVPRPAVCARRRWVASTAASSSRYLWAAAH
jgi:hypothetical protein